MILMAQLSAHSAASRNPSAGGIVGCEVRKCGKSRHDGEACMMRKETVVLSC